MGKLVNGVGLNDAGYVTQKWDTVGYINGKQKLRLVWKCPFYDKWRSMLERCYSEKYLERRPAYKDVVVRQEWLTFSNFKRWMEKQDWEGKQLDKDIIVLGNKVYSPETCAFVLGVTNGFITAREAARGEWPLGVCWVNDRQKYRAQCNNPLTRKLERLGMFTTPEEAHEAWRKRKHELAQFVAETESDPRVVEALKKRYSIEEWYGNKT